jgi:hypothetical protein
MTGNVRLSDTERDRAAAELSEHYAQGRLDAEEHAERLDAIWTARTQSDLEPIFEDLPRPAVARPERAHGRGRAGWRPVPFVPVAALLVVLSVVTHLPFWILIFFVGCGLFSRRVHAWR